MSRTIVEVGRGAHSEPILDREALAEERARLVARLAEIDVLLRYRVGYRAWAARPLAEERARLVARLAEIDALLAE